MNSKFIRAMRDCHEAQMNKFVAFSHINESFPGMIKESFPMHLNNKPTNADRRNWFEASYEKLADSLSKPLIVKLLDLSELSQKLGEQLLDEIHEIEPRDFPEAREINRFIQQAQQATNDHQTELALTNLKGALESHDALSEESQELYDLLYPQTEDD